MDVGQRIKDCRIKKGLSVDELAEKLKKNRATVYRYENGDIENLPITIIEPIAQALETSPAFLMGWTENSAPLSDKIETNKIMETKNPFIPTEHELKVLTAYRNQPAMRPAVDRILGISGKHIRLEGKVAARGFEETTINQKLNITGDGVKKLLDNAAEDIDF